jgi:hypothetical protein
MPLVVMVGAVVLLPAPEAAGVESVLCTIEADPRRVL